MNAELAHHWVAVIRPLLPGDANIEVLPWTGQAGIFFIDRPAPIEGRQHRRSRNARLYFPDRVIAEYLKQAQPVRDKVDAHLADFVRRRVATIDWNHDEPKHNPAPGELFVMDLDVLFP
ncbi:MAG: hypothetical protein WBM28_00075 [Burkholderiales bacterium]